MLPAKLEGTLDRVVDDIFMWLVRDSKDFLALLVANIDLGGPPIQELRFALGNLDIFDGMSVERVH
jgi:hypothetical protein